MTAGRPSTYIPGEVKESEYDSTSHPERLLNLMKEGKLDCEIYADFGITKNTFYRWRREQDDFKLAFELGLPHCEAWWASKIRDCFLRGDDKGFKYCISIMNNKFGWGQDETSSQRITNNTQINVQGNMQVLESKSSKELIELLSADIKYLQHNNILPAEFKDLTDSSDDSSITKPNE